MWTPVVGISGKFPSDVDAALKAIEASGDKAWIVGETKAGERKVELI